MSHKALTPLQLIIRDCRSCSGRRHLGDACPYDRECGIELAGCRNGLSTFNSAVGDKNRSWKDVQSELPCDPLALVNEYSLTCEAEVSDERRSSVVVVFVVRFEDHKKCRRNGTAGESRCDLSAGPAFVGQEEDKDPRGNVKTSRKPNCTCRQPLGRAKVKLGRSVDHVKVSANLLNLLKEFNHSARNDK